MGLKMPDVISSYVEASNGRESERFGALLGMLSLMTRPRTFCFYLRVVACSKRQTKRQAFSRFSWFKTLHTRRPL
jgi:hypothetical protein